MKTTICLKKSPVISFLQRHDIFRHQFHDSLFCVADIDECASWGNNCTQICQNVKGSFKCQCASDFHDVENKGQECKATGTRRLKFLPHNCSLFIIPTLKIKYWVCRRVRWVYHTLSITLCLSHSVYHTLSITLWVCP